MKLDTNFALGYELPIMSNMSLMRAIRSNFSYFDPDTYDSFQIVSEVTQWDKYQFTAGTIFNKNKSSITLGLIFSIVPEALTCIFRKEVH